MMRRRVRFGLWALALAFATVAASLLVPMAFAKPKKLCAPPAAVLRYRDVAPVFARHCGSCHDKRRSDNHRAQNVFESSRYPFRTERPQTLLDDLAEMFEARGKLPHEDRCAVLGWIAAGARDDTGKRPPYEPRSAQR
jgi:hypothetical protein